MWIITECGGTFVVTQSLLIQACQTSLWVLALICGSAEVRTQHNFKKPKATDRSNESLDFSAPTGGTTPHAQHSLKPNLSSCARCLSNACCTPGRVGWGLHSCPPRTAQKTSPFGATSTWGFPTKKMSPTQWGKSYSWSVGGRRKYSTRISTFQEAFPRIVASLSRCCPRTSATDTAPQTCKRGALQK